jgi:hypothetical protein
VANYQKSSKKPKVILDQNQKHMIKPRSESVPQAMQPIHAAIIKLTDAFCRQYLNDEYAALCRPLAAALARKRPSPLLRGQVEIWACAIVYALGTVNFLFDPSQTPHMSAFEVCRLFGVSSSSGANKARQIREMLHMSQFDSTWMLPSLMGDSLAVWLVEVDGFVMDIRTLPREIQELAYQKKLIPYIPADRK